MNEPINIDELFAKRDLYCGRMIAASKSCGPKNCICVWNANIISPTKGKIWFGDLNITREGNLLKEIATELGEPLYVLREMDARFGTENDPIDVLISKAVWSTIT
jgi:hypothetical protein